MQENIKIIDLEHHFYLPAVLDYLRTKTEYPYYRDDVGLWYRDNEFLPLNIPGFNNTGHTVYDEVTDLGELRLKIMDNAGVSVGAISASAIAEVLPREECIKYSRMTNDIVAETVKKYPDRFIGTISLPTPYVEDALKELDRAVNELGLVYWHTHSNYGVHTLDEPMFEPILARCAELDIPFYVHPHCTLSDYMCDRSPMLAGAAFGYGVDTMKTTIMLIIGGIFDRYPNLRMILGHMAEFYPYCMDRMDNRCCGERFRNLDQYSKCEGTFTDYFRNRNILMTTSGIYDANVAMFAINTIGIDSVMFGTDYPYEDFKGEVDFIKSLPLSLEDKEKIFHGNAEKYVLKK